MKLPDTCVGTVVEKSGADVVYVRSDTGKFSYMAGEPMMLGDIAYVQANGKVYKYKTWTQEYPPDNEFRHLRLEM